MLTPDRQSYELASSIPFGPNFCWRTIAICRPHAFCWSGLMSQYSMGTVVKTFFGGLRLSAPAYSISVAALSSHASRSASVIVDQFVGTSRYTFLGGGPTGRVSSAGRSGSCSFGLVLIVLLIAWHSHRA
jgi:hypothetical protein